MIPVYCAYVDMRDPETLVPIRISRTSPATLTVILTGLSVRLNRLLPERASAKMILMPKRKLQILKNR